MRRRLILLNVVLVALTALAAWQLRREWAVAKERERAVLGQRIKPVPPPPSGAQPAPTPVVPAQYNEIAQKMLFSKDRNPVVVVETAPPPPPKPMPPLPIFRGIMNFGDGPVAILSEAANMPNREYKPGQQVGQFKLVAVNTQEIVLDWEGKQISKKVDQLAQRDEPREETSRRSEAPAAAPASAPAPKVEAGPGVDIGKGLRACVPNDSTPAGTVVDGVRKVVTESPFGPMCRWEPVR